MKLLKTLIRLHRFLFFITMFFAVLSILLSLYWNKYLADMINSLEYNTLFDLESMRTLLLGSLIKAVAIIFLHCMCEYVSSYLAAYTCESFAHEMRMGYSRFYLHSDLRILSKLKVGEEQSAMQNELREVYVYLNENLFSLVKQFVSFVVTVIFLLCMNYKLTLFFTLPVIPLIIYCSFSSRIIKNYTEQTQISKQHINGLTGTLLELFPVIQVYDAYRLINNTMNERLQEWSNTNIKKERIAAGLMSFSGACSFIPLLVLLGWGGFMVVNGELSVGIFYIFINLSGNVSGFLQNMPNIYAGFRRFSASADRLENKMILRETSDDLCTFIS